MKKGNGITYLEGNLAEDACGADWQKMRPFEDVVKRVKEIEAAHPDYKVHSVDTDYDGLQQLQVVLVHKGGE